MKFLIKWTKEGNMRYISHLDIMRLFQRALKRAGIKLRYSEGFSPHPKMSIAQPLSLGYTSVGEYFEFETQEDFESNEILEKLNAALPLGIKMMSCSVLRETKKAIGALISQAEYLIGISDLDVGEGSVEQKTQTLFSAVDKFRNQEQVLIKKLQKKSGRQTEIDIRKMVKEIEVKEANDEHIVIRLMVDTGSVSHLNPEYVLAILKKYSDNLLDKASFHVQRQEMYTTYANDAMIPLYFLG